MTSDEKTPQPSKDGNTPTRLRRSLGRCRQRLTDMSMLPHVLWMISLGFTTAAAVGYLIWWLADTPSIDSLVKDVAMLDLIRIALLVTAGIGGIVALVVAYRRQKLGERIEKRDEQAAELARRANDRENTKLFNERFDAASAQIASEHSMVRIAGVYAMADLADDWDEGRQKCINVLCACMRMPYDPPEEEPDLGTGEARRAHQERRAQQQVRRTVMDVIGERLRADPVEGETWHGLNFDLSGAVIDSGDLHDIKLTGGRVDLFGAVFSSGRADFRSPLDWSAPPSFDPFPLGVPAGLLMPEGSLARSRSAGQFGEVGRVGQGRAHADRRGARLQVSVDLVRAHPAGAHEPHIRERPTHRLEPGRTQHRGGEDLHPRAAKLAGPLYLAGGGHTGQVGSPASCEAAATAASRPGATV
ncbi:hypothetical protein GCM10029992_46150 [Glycomyces albus]